MSYNVESLRQDLIRDEGLMLMPYHCTANKLTIGVGRNIQDRGISRAEALYLLDNDIGDIAAWLDRDVPWWRTQSEARQRAMINMGMMGVARLLEFKRMLAAWKAGDYETAAAEALNSKWAAQVGQRAHRVAALIRRG